MKIKIADQLAIYRGELSPPEGNLLKDLVAHMMLQEAHLINDVGFADVTNELAISYVQKMENAINRIIQFDNATIEKFYRYSVMALGEAYHYNNLLGLETDDKWVIKLEAVKLRIIELLAKVSLDEKSAYETL